MPAHTHLPDDAPGSPLRERWLRPIADAILSSNDSPRQVAAGVALGAFLAFTPTIGFQTIIALLLATLLRISRIPCAIMVYISNPFTALPIYTSCYLVGAWICRPLGIPTGDWAHFIQEMGALKELSVFAAAWEGLKCLGRFGIEIAIPLCLGCLIEGLVAAAIAYPVTLRLVEGHRLLRAEKAARRLQRRSHEHDDEEEEDSGGPPPDETPKSGPEAPRPEKEPSHEPGTRPPGD